MPNLEGKAAFATCRAPPCFAACDFLLFFFLAIGFFSIPVHATITFQNEFLPHTVDSRFFTFHRGLASVNASPCNHGHWRITSRNPLHPAAEGGRGILHCRIAGSLEHVSPRAVYGRARFGSEAEVDVVHDTGADRWCDTSPGQPRLPICGSFA